MGGVRVDSGQVADAVHAVAQGAAVDAEFAGRAFAVQVAGEQCLEGAVQVLAGVERCEQGGQALLYVWLPGDGATRSSSIW